MMKKNEIQPGTDKHTSQRAEEDRIFNKMLFWLAGAAVTEILLILINRFYLHAPISQLDTVIALNRIMPLFFVLGILLFAVCLFWGKKVRGQTKYNGVFQNILGAIFLCLGTGGLVMRIFGVNGASIMLGIVPGLAVLMLIYYLYPYEFFVCGILGGLTILGLWLFRTVANPTYYYLYLIAVVIITALGVVLARRLQKNNGNLTVNGKNYQIFSSDSYAAFYLTAAVTLVLLLAPLAFGTAAAYYSIWITAAWLFVLAVYFTSKLI